MYKHLLVPLDGSGLATEIVSQAVSFAAALGARITFVNARADLLLPGSLAVFGPSPCINRWSIGRVNAAVFPVPVAACASRSRPDSIIGIVSRWTGVGSS